MDRLRFLATAAVIFSAGGLLGCQTTDTRVGSGPITLSPHVKAVFERYKSKNSPGQFAVSEDGKISFFTYCAEFECLHDANQAIDGCEQHARKRGQRCKIYAEDGKVVWRGATIADLPDGQGTFNLVWFTDTTLYPGKVVFTDRYSGTLLARNPDREKCDGTFSLSGANLAWSLKCPEGKSISGTIDDYSPASGGYGDGRDQDNQIVEIRIASGIKVAGLPTPTPSSTAAKSDSPSVTKTASPARKEDARPIAFEWEGYPQLVAGTIKLQPDGKGGKMSIQLPQNAGNCTGSYQFTDGRFGTWAIACTDNVAASGTFEGYGKGKGSSGTGTDTQGRKLRFTVGGS